jgi:hypothetical protein
MTTRKLTGLQLFRSVAGQSLARNTHCTFSPDDVLSILYELDKIVPRRNKAMVPAYVKRQNRLHEKNKATTKSN